MLCSPILRSLGLFASLSLGIPAVGPDGLDGYHDPVGGLPRRARTGAQPIATPSPNGDRLLCKNTGGNFIISRSGAEGSIHYAPLNSKTKSGYPHEFKNIGGGIKLPGKCKTVWEFPVFADGHQYQYNGMGSIKKPDPGNARALFSYPSKDYCGVMSHTEAHNRGFFALCQPQ